MVYQYLNKTQIMQMQMVQCNKILLKSILTYYFDELTDMEPLYINVFVYRIFRKNEWRY